MNISKNKKILLHNQHTTLRIRKSTFTLYQESNPQTPCKFCKLSHNVSFSFLVQDSIQEHNLSRLTSVLSTVPQCYSDFCVLNRAQPFHSVGWSSTCMSRLRSNFCGSNTRDMMFCSSQCTMSEMDGKPSLHWGR